MHSDHKYITALLENDRRILSELFSNYSNRVVKLIQQMGGTEQDAADVFQESLISIYQRAQKDFILTCPFDAFIYRVCKNKWLTRLSKKSVSEVTMPDNDSSLASEDVVENERRLLVGEARQNLLEQKLKELGDVCRNLIQLSWSGMSMEQVASQLQLSYGYARKKKSECISKLSDLVKRSPSYEQLKW
jgi:RNA polymerase sigma factor (sigma-70 family)